MQSRTILTVSLPSAMAATVARLQNKLGLTRSELFRTMVRRQLDELDLSCLADEGGAFAFLKREPELYSLNDVRR